MAVSSTTREYMLLDVGTLTWDSTDVGATGRAGSFKVEQTVRTPEFGGAMGPVKATEKVTQEIVTLTMPLKELSFDNLAMLIPTLSASSDASSEYNTQAQIGAIAETAYKEVVWTGKALDGDAVTITLDQARPEGPFEMALDDDNEATINAVFKGYYDPDDADKRCWQITWVI